MPFSPSTFQLCDFWNQWAEGDSSRLLLNSVWGTYFCLVVLKAKQTWYFKFQEVYSDMAYKIFCISCICSFESWDDLSVTFPAWLSGWNMLATTYSAVWGFVAMFHGVWYICFHIMMLMLFLWGCFIGLCLIVVFKIAITLHSQNKSFNSLSSIVVEKVGGTKLQT